MTVTRRRSLQAMSLTGLAGAMGLVGRTLAATPADAVARAVAQSEPMRALAAGGPTGLLGIGQSGALWALSVSGAAPRRMAGGLDGATPLAVGHGRIAARRSDGALWVWERGQEQGSVNGLLAPQAGLLILPFAVIATTASGGDHRLVRLEPDASHRWIEVARSAEAVLPDGRPVQVDLTGQGDGGDLAVLAGPDAERYTHGVLGDSIEATRVIVLERHGLQVQRTLSIAAPFAIEDITLRPVALFAGAPGSLGLLCVRSGPAGAQLALLDADPALPQRLRLAALGEPLGSRNRWLAPSSSGRHWLAVHTPHIGGVLHEYRRDGERLVARRVADDVSTHHIGSRELDLSVTRGRWWVAPDQQRTRLRLFDSMAAWREAAPVSLPAAVVAMAALAEPGLLAVLLDHGRAMVVAVPQAL